MGPLEAALLNLLHVARKQSSDERVREIADQAFLQMQDHLSGMVDEDEHSHTCASGKENTS